MKGLHFLLTISSSLSCFSRFSVKFAGKKNSSSEGCSSFEPLTAVLCSNDYKLIYRVLSTNTSTCIYTPSSWSWFWVVVNSFITFIYRLGIITFRFTTTITLRFTFICTISFWFIFWVFTLKKNIFVYFSIDF
jgi:hypothetical protein